MRFRTCGFTLLFHILTLSSYTLATVDVPGLETFGGARVITIPQRVALKVKPVINAILIPFPRRSTIQAEERRPLSNRSADAFHKNGQPGSLSKKVNCVAARIGFIS